MLRPRPPADFPPPPGIPLCERLTWHLDEGCGSNRKFRRKIFNRLPERFAGPVARRYVELYEGKSEQDANLFLLDIGDRFAWNAADLVATDDQLVDTAKHRARHCSEIAGDAGCLSMGVCTGCSVRPAGGCRAAGSERTDNGPRSNGQAHGRDVVAPCPAADRCASPGRGRNRHRDGPPACRDLRQ